MSVLVLSGSVNCDHAVISHSKHNYRKCMTAGKQRHRDKIRKIKRRISTGSEKEVFLSLSFSWMVDSLSCGSNIFMEHWGYRLFTMGKHIHTVDFQYV